MGSAHVSSNLILVEKLFASANFSFSKVKSLLPVRLELTAFRLWDWRAAYCATEAWAMPTEYQFFLAF